MPLVTIGVPVFNGERHIRRALDSLLKQDYKNIEIIISDNCSCDKTPEILRDYGEKYSFIRIYRNERNIGVHANFCTLLELSSGEYFMWAGIDDYWSPAFVSTLVNELEIYSDAGIAMSAFDRIHPDGALFDSIHFHGNKNPNKKSFLAMALRLTSPLKYNVFIYGLFRTHMLKSSISQLLPIPSGDRWFLTQFALAYRFRYVDQILFIRTLHSLPYQDRYPEDAFVREKIRLAKNTFNFQIIPYVFKVIAKSQVVPWYRKMYLPIILASLFYQKFLKGLRTRTKKLIRNCLPESLIRVVKEIRQLTSNQNRF